MSLSRIPINVIAKLGASMARSTPIPALCCKTRVASLREVNIYEAQSYRHIVNPPMPIEPGDCGLVGSQSPFGVDVAYVRTGFTVARIMQDGSTELFATGCYLHCVDLSTTAARLRGKVVVLDSAVINSLLALPICARRNANSPVRNDGIPPLTIADTEEIS
ncbi:MAG: hypothetical protein ACI9W2_000030 [Gammaproteobacteria bacterium]|jgi:hypothetical protein